MSSSAIHHRPLTQLVIISPYAISAAALQALLTADGQYQVLGTFADAGTCINSFSPGIEKKDKEGPLVLLDLETEDAVSTIAELIAAPLAQKHYCRILVLTGSIDAKLHDAAVTAGASGLVRKTESPSTLFKAIARVAEGELWLDRATTGRIFQVLSRKKPSPVHDAEQEKIETLTRKERVIVSEISDTPSAGGQELAILLNISEHTLRNHLSAIYAKLDVANRTELYAYARQHNIKAPAAKHKKTTSTL